MFLDDNSASLESLLSIIRGRGGRGGDHLMEAGGLVTFPNLGSSWFTRSVIPSSYHGGFDEEVRPMIGNVRKIKENE